MFQKFQLSLKNIRYFNSSWNENYFLRDKKITNNVIFKKNSENSFCLVTSLKLKMKRNSITVFWPLSNCIYFLVWYLMSFRLPNKQTIFAVYKIRYMTLNRYCLLKSFHLFEVSFAKLQNRWEMFEDLTWIFSWKNVCRSELASKKMR